MIIDVHTHLLPGIDDGAKNLKNCMKMLEQNAKADVCKIIATPHYYPWKTNVASNEIRHLCQEVQEKFQKEYGIAMEIYPGQEIFYQIGVVEELKKGNILTLADSRYVLVEFVPGECFSLLHRAVRELTDAGYIPILAHVERYKCLRQKEHLTLLKECGALFQMNINSLQGGILAKDRRWSVKLLKEHWIDFLATDAHDLAMRDPYTKEKILKIQKLVESKYLKTLLYDNGEKIIRNV